MDLEDLKKKKISDLRYIGKMLSIKSMTKMTKQELIEAILASERQSTASDKTETEDSKTALTEADRAESREIEAEGAESVPQERTEIAEDTSVIKPESEQERVATARIKRNRKNNNSRKQKKTENLSNHTENIEESAYPSGNQKNIPEEKKEEPKPQDNTEEAEGLLEILPEGYGFLRVGKYFSGNKDVYVPPTLIRKFCLKTGDQIRVRSKIQRENDKYQALCFINTINGDSIENALKRKPFESLVPIYPDEKIRLETVQNELSTRLIDLIAPIGKGQRGMIVSPPKAGKTVLLKKIANAISENYPEIKLILLLIDERPEEVTDMRESVKGDVISSTFDEMPEKHIKVSEMVFERAKRLVEHGNDVVILMDSLTRLARAYNITISPTGRSLSGGLDPGALYNPKRFFGAARNIRGGGSLTIVATALIDTGSKMDDVIFEEFKGTGNMELHLDRKLSEKRIFPAIDINKSGTRKEELLLSEKELNSVFAIRRAMSNLGTGDVTEMIVNKMMKTKKNEEFIKTINIPQELQKN